MLKNLIRLATLTLVLALSVSVLAHAEAVSSAKTQLEGYQEAVRSQLQELIVAALNDYFTHAGREAPTHVAVKSHADFDLSEREPRLQQLALDVAMTSDQPAAVLREARQRIIKALRGNGYRFEPAATPAEAAMPMVKFNLEVQGPETPDEGNSLREYATLIALALGCIAFFSLAMTVVLRPLRRRQRPDRESYDSGLAPEPHVAGLPGSVAYASAAAGPALSRQSLSGGPAMAPGTSPSRQSASGPMPSHQFTPGGPTSAAPGSSLSRQSTSGPMPSHQFTPGGPTSAAPGTSPSRQSLSGGPTSAAPGSSPSRQSPSGHPTSRAASGPTTPAPGAPAEGGELPPLPTHPVVFRPSAQELPPLSSTAFGDGPKADPKLV